MAGPPKVQHPLDRNCGPIFFLTKGSTHKDNGVLGNSGRYIFIDASLRVCFVFTTPSPINKNISSEIHPRRRAVLRVAASIRYLLAEPSSRIRATQRLIVSRHIQPNMLTQQECYQHTGVYSRCHHLVYRGHSR